MIQYCTIGFYCGRLRQQKRNERPSSQRRRGGRENREKEAMAPKVARGEGSADIEASPTKTRMRGRVVLQVRKTRNISISNLCKSIGLRNTVSFTSWLRESKWFKHETRCPVMHRVWDGNLLWRFYKMFFENFFLLTSYMGSLAAAVRANSLGNSINILLSTHVAAPNCTSCTTLRGIHKGVKRVPLHLEMLYRVTIHLGANLPLTSKQKFHFSIWASY